MKKVIIIILCLLIVGCAPKPVSKITTAAIINTSAKSELKVDDIKFTDFYEHEAELKGKIITIEVVVIEKGDFQVFASLVEKGGNKTGKMKIFVVDDYKVGNKYTLEVAYNGIIDGLPVFNIISNK